MLQAALLVLAVTGWYARRENTIFGNGRWMVGKDLGKFVFYTYSFLCKPLVKGRIVLTDDMAFQEILYREPESPRRRLNRLHFKAFISNDAYLWVLLQKDGFQSTGCRLSRHTRFPSGFFRHGTGGDLAERVELDRALPQTESGWCHVEAVRTGELWSLNVEGQPMGTFPVSLMESSRFGFRGSGNSRNIVHVRRIEMTFEDPVNGRTWTEREDFRPRYLESRHLIAAILFSFLLLGLRAGRQRLLAHGLAPEVRLRYLRADGLGLLTILTVLASVRLSPSGTAIPGSILAAEAVSVAVFAWFRRTPPSEPLPGAPLSGVLLFGGLIMTLSAAAFVRHGEWLGRAADSIWSHLDYVEPGAYNIRPPQGSSSPSTAIREPVTLIPGQPFFFPGAYRDQVVRADVVMGSWCTLDIVFQQQSYLNRGDLAGEELPLQRRLVRLSTREGIPMGMATSVTRGAAPFCRLSGALRPGAQNSIEIASDDHGLRIRLNGHETSFPAMRPLGYGVTGFMVYEPEVTLLSASVEPTAARTRHEHAMLWWGISLPLALLTAIWLLFRLAGRISYREWIPPAIAAQYGLGVYLAATLFVPSGELAAMGRDRLGWLDLLLCATAVGHFCPLIAFRSRLRVAALYGNAIFLAAIFFAALYVWDRVLPAEHPLRARFAQTDNVAPGELVSDNTADGSPWYSNNGAIGFNTYIWSQRFGTKRIPAVKPPGTIRIFVLGGSQAWGSGAASSADTFDEILERKLRALGRPVEVFNAGVNGAGISKVATLYRDLVSGFDPDIVIANVGLNDSAALRMKRDEERRANHRQALVDDYEDLLRTARDQGVSVLLALEAMCSETPLRPDKEYYAKLTALAGQYGAAVVEPGPVIREMEQTHFVWWDTAHYAPFGHELLARQLEPEMDRLVQARLSDQK